VSDDLRLNNLADEANGLSTVLASVAPHSGRLALFRLDRSFLGLV
jgi:hypothetical protein